MSNMPTKTTILEILKRELPSLERDFKVERLGLFGSFARGEQRGESDIDIVVEFKEPVGFFTFMDLEYYLEEKLGAEVDLVTPDAIKPLMKPYIMREAVYV
jgi:predicted nucleotidyltransferase